MFTASHRLSFLFFCLLSSSLLAQDLGRNITIPTPPSTTSTAPSPASTGTRSEPANSTSNNNGPLNNSTASRTNSTASTGSNGNKTSAAPAPLAPIKDAGGPTSVPVPGSSGGKANGAFGPDDQYIAGVGRLGVPLTWSLALMVVLVGWVVEHLV